MDDLEKRFNDLSESPIFRGDRGYGRKTSSRSVASAVAGPVSIHHYNDSDQKTTIETVEDCTTILKANQADMNSGHDGYSQSRDLKHVARIPASVVDQFYRQGIDLTTDEGWQYVKALLDDPEYSKFRSHGGKLSSKPRREFVTAKTRGRKN